MKNRRSFLSAVAGGGLTVAMAATTGAAAGTAAPSPAALATAATFTEFDPALSDAELRAIANYIDRYRAAAKTLNPKGKRLRNSDELVVRFAAGETIER